MAEIARPSREALEAFEQGRRNMEHTAALQTTLNGLEGGIKVVREAHSMAPKTFEVPGGHVFQVMPARRDNTLVHGLHHEPYRTHGEDEHSIHNPVSITLEEGQTFQGNLLAVSYNRLLVINTVEGTGCEVPEPPLMHVQIVPVQA